MEQTMEFSLSIQGMAATFRDNSVAWYPCEDDMM